MFRALVMFVLAASVLSSAPANATDPLKLDESITRKLHDLGYPANPTIAIQRWRADTDRRGQGPLTPEETAALIAHPLPEFFAAMAGNPFTGMGLAVRHTTRDEAEREAVRLCKAQGGGATCANPLVTRAEHCVAILGFNVTINRRPTYRTSVAVSPDMKLSLDRGMEGCQNGATHPHLCAPLVTYCGDGRSLEMFDAKPAAETADAAGRG